MPLAECTGTRNWGYDGVLLFAPYHVYGTPDDLRAFVDTCHGHGLAVILDVVYNHIGAVGDSTAFLLENSSRIRKTAARGARSYNLDGENSRAVRHFLLQNVAYWLDEFRFGRLSPRRHPRHPRQLAQASHRRGHLEQVSPRPRWHCHRRG